VYEEHRYKKNTWNKDHIAQGVKSEVAYVVGDNTDKVQQESEEKIMLCKALLKS